jgi:hypothetical protein
VGDTNAESVVVLARRKPLSGNQTVARADRWIRLLASLARTLKLNISALAAAAVN